MIQCSDGCGVWWGDCCVEDECDFLWYVEEYFDVGDCECGGDYQYCVYWEDVLEVMVD